MMVQVQREREEKMKKEEAESLVREKESKLMSKKLVMREEFAKEVINDKRAITIVFRMPNMIKVEKKFDREDPVKRMYDFVSVCENSGMEKKKIFSLTYSSK